MTNTGNATGDGVLVALRESEIRLLTDIGTTLTEMGASAQDDKQRLLDVAHDLREMFFLVVVIGEFNAGKSSFINALLGDALLPMGVTPTTEAIELIRYNEVANRKPEMRLDGIREWAHPNTGGAGVALVDTPGTGSVFQKHEKTAKEFLHRADLVIFVMSAKRAFAETERMYLEMAQHFGKKIILVVNQVDLLQAKEQAEVRRFIEQQADEMLHFRPLLFMVSAKESLMAAQAGPITGDPGGMEGLKGHLRGVLSEAPPTKQKLLAQLSMAEHLLRGYLNEVQHKADTVKADTGKVKDVERELEQQSLGLEAQLKSARADIDKVFEGVRARGMQFIDDHVSLRQIASRPSREQLQAAFQEQVVGRALREINGATDGYINAVVDNSRLYWRGVIDRLNQLRDLMEQELSGLDAGVYAEQRQSLQDAIRIAETELKSYSTGKIATDIHSAFEGNINGFTATAGVTVVGLVILVAEIITKSALIAGPLGAAVPPLAIGVTALSGLFAWRYYRRMTEDSKRDLHAKIDGLESAFHDALNDLTNKERNRLTQYGKQVLMPVFSRLEVLSNRHAAQAAALRAHLDQVDTLRGGIEKL